MGIGAMNYDNAFEPNFYISFARTGIKQSWFVQAAEPGTWCVVQNPPSQALNVCKIHAKLVRS